MHWYVLRSKPNKEDALWGEVCARGHEAYYPRLRVQPVNPRARRVRPYFPGYLFIHVDLSAVGFSALNWMPYSNGLVSFDSEPASVPDGLVNAIRRRVEGVNAAGGELFHDLQPGDPVVVHGGPFAGYEAIFDARLPGTERVRVFLKLLQRRQMEAVLPAGYIEKKKVPARFRRARK